MSYLRPMGDGPVMDPSEVDPSIPAPWNPNNDSTNIGTVTTPKRVSCDELPPDDPWRKPGGPCAPTDWSKMFDVITGAVTGAAPSSSGSGGGSIVPKLLLLAAIGGGAYYYATSKKVR